MDSRLKHASASFESPKGLIKSAWKKQGKSTVFSFEVPFDTEADFVFTFDTKNVTVNGKVVKACKTGTKLHFAKGSYEIIAD